MLLFRCAWHRQYRGYPMVYGVASWRGAGVRFSDGICDRCARRWRIESRLGRRALAAPLIPRGMPRVGVALALALATVFTARPASHPPDFRVMRSAAHHDLIAFNDVAPSASITSETTSAPKPAATSVARLLGDPPHPRLPASRPVQVASTGASARLTRMSARLTGASARLTGNKCPCAPSDRRDVAANRATAANSRTQSPLRARVIPASMPAVEPRRLPLTWLWARLQETPSPIAAQAPPEVAALQSP